MIEKIYSSHFSSEDFLEDVGYEAKQQFGSIQEFAKVLGVHRNTITNVLNNPDKLKPFWMYAFAEALNLDLHYYYFR